MSTAAKTAGWLLLAFLVCAGPARAADAWRLLPEESSLRFTARQANAPTEGSFATFSGDIVFDPDALDQSRIAIDVDMASVSSTYDQVPQTLVTAPWFDAGRFPVARYQSQSITARPDGSYAVAGTLSLRGVSAPVALTFRFENYGPKAGDAATLRAVAVGEAHLSRTAFGVGQGEWAKTSVVADDVALAFTIVAERPVGDP